MFEVRPFNKFFDLTEFSVPSDSEVLVKRWQANVQYWAGNYAVCTCACLVFAFIIRPWSLVFGILGAACLAYLHTMHKDQALVLPVAFSGALSALRSSSGADSSISKRNIQIAVAVVTVVLVAYCQGVYFLASLLLAACVLVAHLTFRQRTLGAKMSSGLDAAVSLVSDAPPSDPLSIAAAALVQQVPDQASAARQQRSMAEQQRYLEERERRNKEHRAIAEKWGVPPAETLSN